MKSLYQRVRQDILSNPVFYYNIHFLTNAFIVSEEAAAWVAEENGKVYLCTYKFRSLDNTFIHYCGVKEFLVKYRRSVVLETVTSYKYRKVVYELLSKNNRAYPR